MLKSNLKMRPTERGCSLGLKSVAPFKLVDQVNAGLPIKAWDTFIAFSGLDNDEVAQAVLLPLRTLSRRRKKGKLGAEESDRLVRFSIILEKAVELFDGDRAEARRWLRTPQPALGGRIPIHLAQTTVGTREVEDLIGRLEHGVYT